MDFKTKNLKIDEKRFLITIKDIGERALIMKNYFTKELI